MIAVDSRAKRLCAESCVFIAETQAIAHSYWNQYSESREKTLLRILGYWNIFLEKYQNEKGSQQNLYPFSFSPGSCIFTVFLMGV
jgi:hypothetical protein